VDTTSSAEREQRTRRAVGILACATLACGVWSMALIGGPQAGWQREAWIFISIALPLVFWCGLLVSIWAVSRGTRTEALTAVAVLALIGLEVFELMPNPVVMSGPLPLGTWLGAAAALIAGLALVKSTALPRVAVIAGMLAAGSLVVQTALALLSNLRITFVETTGLLGMSVELVLFASLGGFLLALAIFFLREPAGVRRTSAST